MFIDYGSNRTEFSRLVLNTEKENFKVYLQGEEIRSGTLNNSDIQEVTSLIGKIKLADLNRIYDVNSSDRSLFMVKFWGVNTDYAYMLETFGTSGLPIEVEMFVNYLRRKNKILGRIE